MCKPNVVVPPRRPIPGQQVTTETKGGLDSLLALGYFMSHMNDPGVEPSVLLEEDAQVARSLARILRHQHDSGAFVASADFAQYQYCWLRDGSFTAYALDRAGRHDAARRFHEWCAAAVNRAAPRISAALEQLSAGLAVPASAMPPARFSLDGSIVEDEWPNFQVDGYGTWLWSLWQHLGTSSEVELPEGLRSAAEQAAAYLNGFGTSACFDVWEENGGSVHTSTLACVYGGLSAGAEVLADPALAARAEQVRAMVLDQGHRDGVFSKSDHDRGVDAALLWLSEPFHLVHPGDEAFGETLRRISVELDFKGGTRRYRADRYYGGGAWAVLTASLGLCYASAGNLAEAGRRLSWLEAHVDPEGRLAEQFGGEERDPEAYSEWVAHWGPPAADLAWSHAMYVLLAVELANAGGTPGL